MAHLLDGVRLKIDRAKEHVFDLDQAKVAFLASNPYAVTTKFDRKRGMSICLLDRCTPIPARLALIAGDAAHNLRSALDHLAIALVEANGGVISISTAFPIYESLRKYEAESARKIKGMRQEAKDAISRLAPYQGGNDVLWGIHELDRIDKHRVLITVASIVARIGMEMGPKEMNQIAPYFVRFGSDSIATKTYWFDADLATRALGAEQGDEILSIVGNFEENQNIKFAFDIALGQPKVFEGKPLVETLSTAIQAIENLLTDFAPFLL